MLLVALTLPWLINITRNSHVKFELSCFPDAKCLCVFVAHGGVAQFSAYRYNLTLRNFPFGTFYTTETRVQRLVSHKVQFIPTQDSRTPHAVGWCVDMTVSSESRLFLNFSTSQLSTPKLPTPTTVLYFYVLQLVATQQLVAMLPCAVAHTVLQYDVEGRSTTKVILVRPYQPCLISRQCVIVSRVVVYGVVWNSLTVSGKVFLKLSDSRTRESIGNWLLGSRSLLL